MIDNCIICPILALSDGHGPAYCIGERCAWWSFQWSGCAMEALALELAQLNNHIEKTGHE